MNDSVIYDQDGAVVTLTLNEPETRNAISSRIEDGIVAACERVNSDLSVGCVVLTGAGRSFSSGGNVKEMRERQGYHGEVPVQMRRILQHGIQRIPRALYDVEVPTIAAVNGHAVGAGCDLSLMCDIRIAAEDAQFAESFLRVGIVSGDGGAWFLPRVVGLSRAYEMSFTGEFVPAEKALAWGLVSSVVPNDGLLPDALALARRIANNPPHSLRLYKKLIRESQHMPLSASLEMAAGMLAQINHSQDQQEALAAFLDKRTPNFVGR